jgi:NADH-quinone oxidoreductase subunit N
MNATIDQIALLPLYAAAVTALLALVTDLIVPHRRGAVLAMTALGAVGTAATAWIVGTGRDRGSFCVPAGCSLVADHTGALVAVLFALLTLAVIALSAGWLTPEVPAGEFCFLLAASMTGGVALGYARDLITLLVALETLTLPLYALVALRRRSVASAEGAVSFFIVSVISSAVTLLGAALLYAVTGALHFDALRSVLAGHPELRDLPLTRAAVVLVLAGLAFKVAAVPFHAWAPAAYDGAPTPIAAYLSTASKLGGVIAIVYVAVRALGPSLAVTGPILAALAAVTMTIGTIVALRQDRMVRLLAWSSIAQAGYIIAPLGVAALARGRTADVMTTAVAATIAYTIFYVVLEIGAFGSVIALRGPDDGGWLGDYRGAARRRPWIGVAFVLALIGLAGLPPGLAGLFAKIVVVRSLLTGGALWLAIIVGVNAVIGLAYYARVIVIMCGPVPSTQPASSVRAATSVSDMTSVGDGPFLRGAPSVDDGPSLREAPSLRGAPSVGDLASLAAGRRLAWPVAVALIVVTAAGLIIGFAPELIFHMVDSAAILNTHR